MRLHQSINAYMSVGGLEILFLIFFVFLWARGSTKAREVLYKKTKARAHFERCFGFARCEETRVRDQYSYSWVFLLSVRDRGKGSLWRITTRPFNFLYYPRIRWCEAALTKWILSTLQEQRVILKGKKRKFALASAIMRLLTFKFNDIYASFIFYFGNFDEQYQTRPTA